MFLYDVMSLQVKNLIEILITMVIPILSFPSMTRPPWCSSSLMMLVPSLSFGALTKTNNDLSQGIPTKGKLCKMLIEILCIVSVWFVQMIL
jgi:hypothetical protein